MEIDFNKIFEEMDAQSRDYVEQKIRDEVDKLLNSTFEEFTNYMKTVQQRMNDKTVTLMEIIVFVRLAAYIPKPSHLNSVSN